MARGYPIDFRTPARAAFRNPRGGALAVAIAREAAPTFGRLAMSAARMSPPRIPPPSPALFFAVGAAGLLAYATQPRRAAQPDPDMPPVSPYMVPGGYSISPLLTPYILDSNPYKDRTGVILVRRDNTGDYPNRRTHGVEHGYVGDFRHAVEPTWKSILYNEIDTNVPIYDQHYYSIVTEVWKRPYDDIFRWFYTWDRYQNRTGATINAYKKKPVAVNITVPPKTMPISQADPMPSPSQDARRGGWLPWYDAIDKGLVDVDDLIETLIPPDDPAATRRGIGIGVNTDGMVRTVNPMMPMPETKVRMTAASYLLLSYVSSLGEATDTMRCWMRATGNTYGPNNRPIPKRDWVDAIRAMTGTRGVQSVTRGSRVMRRNFTQFRNGYWLTTDNRVLTSEQVARDFMTCFLRNAEEDLRYALLNQALNKAFFGPTGLDSPLGVQSLYNLTTGNTPYAGLFDLNLR